MDNTCEHCHFWDIKNPQGYTKENYWCVCNMLKDEYNREMISIEVQGVQEYQSPVVIATTRNNFFCGGFWKRG